MRGTTRRRWAEQGRSQVHALLHCLRYPQEDLVLSVLVGVVLLSLGVAGLGVWALRGEYRWGWCVLWGLGVIGGLWPRKRFWGQLLEAVWVSSSFEQERQIRLEKEKIQREKWLAKMERVELQDVLSNGKATRAEHCTGENLRKPARRL